MFQKKGELLSGLPNVFGIADDIFIVGFDELHRYHDEKLDQVLKICRKANLNLNKANCLLKCTSIPFLVR